MLFIYKDYTWNNIKKANFKPRGVARILTQLVDSCLWREWINRQRYRVYSPVNFSFLDFNNGSARKVKEAVPEHFSRCPSDT